MATASPAGPVAREDLDAIIVRDAVEAPAPQLWQQRRARRTVQSLRPESRCPLARCTSDDTKRQSKSTLCATNTCPDEHAHEIVADVAEARRVLHHLPVDLRERRDHRRDRALGIHQRLERLRDDAVAHHDSRDLRDAVAGPRARARGLDVDDDVGQRPELVAQGRGIV